MEGTLKIGDRIKTSSGDSVTIEKFIAAGGQGEVYKVRYQGQEKALKWYMNSFLDNNSKKNDFYENIKNNVHKGSPSEEFLWPLEITEWKNGSFGYIMDLRPEGYYDLSKFILRKAKFKSFRTIIDACLRIVSAYRQLHNKGCSYQDLNDGNFFINPDNGKVLICDNDNVAPNNTDMGMMGKARYMAPEIVRRDNRPNTQSDIFSMSIILYILFCLNHPLEGKRYTTPGTGTSDVENKVLYGTDPIFIMDPRPNNPNGPDNKKHKNSIMVWKALPEYIKDIFLKSFSKESCTDPNKRPQERDWLKLLTRFRSEIIDCPYCHKEVFTQEGASCKCDSCGKTVNIPLRLSIENAYKIPATKATRIYRCQISVCNDDSALTPTLSIVPKTDTGELYVWNKTKEAWDAKTPSGVDKKVLPDKKVPLKNGIKFKIDGKIIEVQENK